MAANYEVIFDISQQSFDWLGVTFPFASLAALGIGFATLSRGDRLRAMGAIIAAVSLVLLICSASLATYLLHRLKAEYSAGRFTVVEGVVDEFRPDAHSGQQTEVFSIEGHFFALRPSWGPGFNQTVSQGGPDLSGKCVRIAFIDPNEILWLGVRHAGCAHDAD